jgi:hypothetical protein
LVAQSAGTMVALSVGLMVESMVGQTVVQWACCLAGKWAVQ